LTTASQAMAQPARWLVRLAQQVADSMSGVSGRRSVSHRA